jgi:hypothetical protein
MHHGQGAEPKVLPIALWKKRVLLAFSKFYTATKIKLNLGPPREGENCVHDCNGVVCYQLTGWVWWLKPAVSTRHDR